MMAEKKAQHEAFWRGEGPGLILIPPKQRVQYDVESYAARFHDPQAMWANEMAKAREVLDWPTDGIPTIRPNLGVVFVPAIAGQAFDIEEGSMPWPGAPLTREAILRAGDLDPETCDLIRLAREFYQIHQASGETEVAAYLPDTQGVFDIAHLLRGDDIFMDLADPDEREWIDGIMAVCQKLYEEATRLMKDAAGEENATMMHGHSTPQGLYFSTAGARIAEDTATLLSPGMIADIIVPSVEKCIQAFDGIFLHYCGRHEDLFKQLVALPGIKAVDLGNPEMYALDDLMSWCADTDTVLHSRLPAEPGETWRAYIERIAAAARRAGARVALRPLVFPDNRAECADMRDCWHECTTW